LFIYKFCVRKEKQYQADTKYCHENGYPILIIDLVTLTMTSTQNETRYNT
jgi:hypothetical protein